MGCAMNWGHLDRDLSIFAVEEGQLTLPQELCWINPSRTPDRGDVVGELILINPDGEMSMSGCRW